MRSKALFARATRYINREFTGNRNPAGAASKLRPTIRTASAGDDICDFWGHI
ncbi:MAG: hypothetical protein WA211_04080 [Candidatus Acidiferrales bacterium]